LIRSHKDIELYKRIDEVVHYLWDPAGIADIPSARDEYYDYLPGILQVVKEAETIESIKVYLSKLEAIQFGEELHDDICTEIAKILFNWKACIMGSTA